MYWSSHYPANLDDMSPTPSAALPPYLVSYASLLSSLVGPVAPHQVLGAITKSMRPN